MSSKPLPPAVVLRSIFNYSPETGVVTRKRGGEAFTTVDRRGYRHGKVGGTNYQAHRVIWKMVTGDDPDTIDHINGQQGDNRWANLRNCSNAQNSQNYAKPPGATSVYRGVYWVRRDRKWASRISNGKGGKVSLGNYDDEIAAARAYDHAAREMHGPFATLNFPEEVQL